MPAVIQAVQVAMQVGRAVIRFQNLLVERQQSIPLVARLVGNLVERLVAIQVEQKIGLVAIQVGRLVGRLVAIQVEQKIGLVAIQVGLLVAIQVEQQVERLQQVAWRERQVERQAEQACKVTMNCGKEERQIGSSWA